MQREFGLTALGIASPLGIGKAKTVEGLRKGSTQGLKQRNDLLIGGPALVGEVDAELPEVPADLRDFNSRNNRLAMLALEEIASDIEDLKLQLGADRISVVVGTSTSGIEEGTTALEGRLTEGAWPADYTYTQQEAGSLGEFVAQHLGLVGPAYTVATACSSSGKAIASGRRLIQAGLCDAAIVGGCDSLCRLTVNGFASLDSLSPTGCNPFSKNRNGIAIGEAAVFFILSKAETCVQLVGIGESSDAYHANAPHPEGLGAIAAMESALKDAGLRPQDINYINLHGTATPLNDAMESKAVRKVFGDRIPCSSTKGMTGHTLGAASALEAAFLWLTLHPEYAFGTLPPHIWDGEADPALAPVNLATLGTPTLGSDRHFMLSNSFAFGGSNIALILGGPE